MDEKKLQQLLDELKSAAANFAYEASDPDFCVNVSISCSDGWASAKQI